MNKEQLVNDVAGATKVTKREVEAIINAFTSTVEAALSRGESVVLANFGKFSVKERSAKKGRNPKTGESIDIPAKKVPTFKAGKQFKELV